MDNWKLAWENEYQIIYTESLWVQIWKAQGERCATCNRKVKIEDTAKSSYSFKIVCKDCYYNPQVMVVLDEWSYN